MPAQVIETEMSNPVRARALSRFAGLRSFVVPVALLMIGAAMLWLCWWARDPHRFAPDAPALEPLRDVNHYPNVARVYPNINRPGLPTPYPPGAQLIYLLINWLQPLRVTVFKAAAMGFDTLTILALMWTLGR